LIKIEKLSKKIAWGLGQLALAIFLRFFNILIPLLVIIWYFHLSLGSLIEIIL